MHRGETGYRGKQWNMRYGYTILTVALCVNLSMPVQVDANIQENKITICMLDSGCNEETAEGKNYLDGSENLRDEENHGTRVYQILKENAPDAKVYVQKCFSDGEALLDRTESEQNETEEALIQAIYDAVDVYEADIINMSWTLNQESENLHAAVQYAAANGVILVAAAGNLSFSTALGSEVYPAAWEEVIGVAGTDLDEKGNPVESLWYLHSDAVFVAADGNYEDEKGSSFAAPRISAVIASYLSCASKKKKSSEKVKDYLKSIAIDAGDEGYDQVFGWGYIVTKTT